MQILLRVHQDREHGGKRPTGQFLFDIAGVVGYGIYTDVLKNDHGCSPFYDTKKDIILARSLECDIESQTVAVKTTTLREHCLR